MPETIVITQPESNNEETQQAILLGQTSEQVQQLQTQLEEQQNKVVMLEETIAAQNQSIQQLQNQPPIIQTTEIEPEIEEEAEELELIEPPELEQPTEPEPQPMEAKKTHWLMEWMLK